MQAVVPAMCKVSYNTARDFVPVSAIVDSPMLLLARSTKELVALAKAKPGQITFGSAPGATPHIGTERLKQMARIDLMLIPYKGEGPALRDLMGGQILMMLSNLPVSMPHLKSGRPRALSSAMRAPTLPDLPTIAESGVPRDIINKLGVDSSRRWTNPKRIGARKPSASS